MTMGQEVVEETGKVIAIKDLLNPAGMPFEDTIRRSGEYAADIPETMINHLFERETPDGKLKKTRMRAHSFFRHP